jgi:hypothetical protein
MIEDASQVSTVDLELSFWVFELIRFGEEDKTGLALQMGAMNDSIGSMSKVLKNFRGEIQK